MNIKKFDNFMNVIENSIDAGSNQHEKKAGMTFIQNGKWALHYLESVFEDKEHNIRRWLNAKPCVYVSDRTGQRIEIDIGNEREALYYFLIFCKKIANNQEISEDFRDYIALIISRSNSKDWEEC